MSDSESTESIEAVKDYFESLEYGEEISFDDFKKVSDKFTKEDYLKFFEIKFNFDWCCYEEAEGLVEEFYKIVVFVSDQLDKEEFQKILEDCLIIQLKRSCNEFSISLLKKFYCESKFNFDINKFVIPTLEGLLINSKKNSDDFEDFSEDIIHFLKIHGANFDTDEVKLIVKKFSDYKYEVPLLQDSGYRIKSDQINLNNLIKKRYKCSKCCSANNK